MTTSSMIRFAELEATAKAEAERFRAKQPFPHLLFDQLVEESALPEIDAAFPDLEWSGWVSRDKAHQRKKCSCRDLMALTDPLFKLVAELSSGRFIRWLEQVTGIDHLLPDPHLDGGGLHLTPDGGWLTPHTDFHTGKIPNFYRRINLLFFVNKDWTEANGGALELWDKQSDKIMDLVPPELGTCVIFQTDADSVHGFSTPVAGRSRRSVALYYYTAEKPAAYSGDTTVYWRAQSLKSRGPVHWLRLQVQRAFLAIARGFSIGSYLMARIGGKAGGQ